MSEKKRGPGEQSPRVRIEVLEDRGDERGSSFPAPASLYGLISAAQDLHITTLRPGCVRGNHYHKLRREVSIVIYSDRWSLYYNRGPQTGVEQQSYDGEGAALLEIDPFAAHAILNQGRDVLTIISFSDGPFDPQSPDVYRERLV